MGSYAGFDAALHWPPGVPPLLVRAVFNSGDGDCNDGYWGAVWDRATGAEIVKIVSSGDMQSTFEAVSQEHIARFEAAPFHGDMPLVSQEKVDLGDEFIPFIFVGDAFHTSRNLVLERIVLLAVKLFHTD